MASSRVCPNPCCSPRTHFPPLPSRRLHTPASPSTTSSTPPSSSPSPSHPTQYFSGIQPTGIVHLGNYLGAIRPWLELQAQVKAARTAGQQPPANKLLISIVDLHAITVPQSPASLHSHSLSLAALLLACGLDPSHTSLFLQSHVPAHSELTWLLSCLTPHAWLGHMTQFKEKSRAAARSPSSPHSLGLFSYPLLMAADVLLYRTTVVPVGHDQAQHLELTRSIASRFNTLYCPPPSPPYFPLPSTLTSSTPRVMSLRDPTRKMSKSDPVEAARIAFTDSPEVIAAKVRRAVTDSEEGVPGEGEGERVGREGMRNLVGMLVGCGGRTWEEVRRDERYWRGRRS